MRRNSRETHARLHAEVMTAANENAAWAEAVRNHPDDPGTNYGYIYDEFLTTCRFPDTAAGLRAAKRWVRSINAVEGLGRIYREVGRVNEDGIVQWETDHEAEPWIDS